MSVLINDDVLHKVFGVSGEVSATYDKKRSAAFEITIQNVTFDVIITSPEETVNAVLLIAPHSELVKIFEMNSKLKESFYQLADDAFKNEYCYKTGDVQKTTEKNQKVSPNSENFSHLLINSQTGELITSIYAEVYNDNQKPAVYLWCLFTNPKYYRQGYAESLLKFLIAYNLNPVMQSMGFSPTFMTQVYCWNTPSINLFRKKMGFKLVGVAPSALNEDLPEGQEPVEPTTYEFNGDKLFEDQELILAWNPEWTSESEMRLLQKTIDEEPKEPNYQSIEKT